MNQIDQLLQYVTTNTDKIIAGISKPNDEFNIPNNVTEEEFCDVLLEMIYDGEIELIEEDGEIKCKLAE